MRYSITYVSQKNKQRSSIRRNLILYFIFLIPIRLFIIHAQVGIGTTDPKATFEVKTSDNDEVPNGLLIPRLTATEVYSMQGKIGADQNSLLIYVTETFTVIPSEFQYTEMDSKGYYYYYYDTVSPTKSLWKKINSGNIKLTAGAGIEINKGVISATGLERITESNGTQTNTGWRLIGRNFQHYLTTGEGAVDFSYNNGGNSRIAKSGASGDYSMAMGFYTKASGHGSVAMGNETEAEGTSSFAMGYKSSALGRYSLAFGYEAKTLGDASFSFGNRTNSFGNGAFSAGWLSKAMAKYAIAIGNNANAMQEYAVSIGSQTGAYKKGSIVIGSGAASLAYSNYAIAIGSGIMSYGEESIGVGRNLNLQGKNAIAIGNNLNTLSMGTIAMGQYATKEKEGDKKSYQKNFYRLFIVGNGEEDSSRSDAFSILRNGVVGININNFEKLYSSDENMGHIIDAQFQVNGAIQSRGISNSNASSENYKIVVATNDKDILKTVTKSELQTAFSDVRLKDYIQPLSIDEDILSKLIPVEFYWNEKGKNLGGNDKLQYGFIAQDIERVFPNLVNKIGEDYQGVDYIQFVAVLTAILQEKSRKIDQLEQMLKKQKETSESRERRLEERLEKLEKMIKK